MTPRQQGEMLFRLAGRTPRFTLVPVALLDTIVSVLGTIGRYYASESMLVWDAAAGRYDAVATPSTETKLPARIALLLAVRAHDTYVPVDGISVKLNHGAPTDRAIGLCSTGEPMPSKIVSAALFTCASLVAALVLPPTRASAQTPVAAASTCANEISAVDNKIQAFDRQVKEDATGFLIDGATDAALADARSVIKNRTSPPSARLAAHSAYQTWIDNFERISKSYGVTLEDLERCLVTSGCSMLEFSARQSQAFRTWMESYLSGSTQDALSRVRAVRTMLTGYVKQLGGTAAGSATAAVQCMKQYERAQVANADAVDLSAASAAKAPAANPPASPVVVRKGVSKAKLGLAVGAIVGGGLALGYALNQLAEPDISAVTGIDFSGGVGGFGAFFSVFITPAIDQIPITCTWRGNSGRQVTRSTTTSPGGTASCANADVASWPDTRLDLTASVTGRSELTITRIYYP